MGNCKQNGPQKHLWEPVDTEGYTLVCSRCGMQISAWENPDINGQTQYAREVDAYCPGEMKQN